MHLGPLTDLYGTPGAPKRARFGPEWPFWRPRRSSDGPGGPDLVPTAPNWFVWVGIMVTTHFDLVSGPFHSPIFIWLHSVSTSASMYHLNTRAGELPRSASSHFAIIGWQVEELSREFLGRRFFVSLPSSLKTSRKPGYFKVKSRQTHLGPTFWFQHILK